MAKRREESPKSRVLIVEDNLDLMNTLEEVLIEDGYEVITAQDGAEGIKNNRKNSPDLIILDLKMPRMDGIETLRRIRKTDKDVIVIILTAYGSSETAREAVDLDVHEYISKPFDSGVMKEAVKEALAAGKRGKDA
jgi:DNA-binding response OmpR family regulator